jgi:protein arginine kinase activator
MYCDECKQKLASVHLTQMFQGQKIEMHLCETCAAKKGALLIFDQDNNFTIPQLLGSFLGNPYDFQEFQPVNNQTVCPNCGMSITNIIQTGKIGCSECYSTFDRELEPTFRRISGNTEHVGKIPNRSGENILLQRKIDELKNRLQQAVSNEQYEQAVEIRDAIKTFEKDL